MHACLKPKLFTCHCKPFKSSTSIFAVIILNSPVPVDYYPVGCISVVYKNITLLPIMPAQLTAIRTTPTNSNWSSCRRYVYTEPATPSTIVLTGWSQLNVSEYKEYTHDKNFALHHWCLFFFFKVCDAGRKIDANSDLLSDLVRWIVSCS